MMEIVQIGSELISLQKLATILINRGLAATHLEGGGITTVKPFILANYPTSHLARYSGGIEFPAGAIIKMEDDNGN